VECTAIAGGESDEQRGFMANIGSWAARIVGAALACVASVGEASFHLFQINQIYSDTTGRDPVHRVLR
jgi:hypothetical protein